MLEISLYGVRKMVLNMAKAKRRASSSFLILAQQSAFVYVRQGPFLLGFVAAMGFIALAHHLANPPPLFPIAHLDSLRA